MLEKALRERLKAEFPDGKPLTVLGRDFVIRAASPAEWRRYLAYTRSGNDDKVSEANILLAKACVVYPSAEELDKLFEELPGFPGSLWAPCRKITGATEDYQLGEW